MCCDSPVQNGVRNAADCKCYKAVMRAYGGLIAAGQPQSTALEAATIVYRHHHPEETPAIAGLTVERWTHEKSLH